VLVFSSVVVARTTRAIIVRVRLVSLLVTFCGWHCITSYTGEAPGAPTFFYSACNTYHVIFYYGG
jgi:hypothetical protein